MCLSFFFYNINYNDGNIKHLRVVGVLVNTLSALSHLILTNLRIGTVHHSHFPKERWRRYVSILQPVSDNCELRVLEPELCL